MAITKNNNGYILKDAFISNKKVITIDTVLSEYSDNPVANYVITKYLKNIKIEPTSICNITKFKVFPTDENFTDKIDPITGLQYSDESDLTGDTHKLTIVSDNNPITKMSDVVIDWGDGTVFEMSSLYNSSNSDQTNIIYSASKPTKSGKKKKTSKKQILAAAVLNSEPEVISNDGYNTIIQHKYNKCNKVYTVSITGDDYFAITHSDSNNLMCECFTSELPIAKNLTKLDNFCAYAPKLVKVEISQTIDLSKITSAKCCFTGSKNLISAIHFNHRLDSIRNVNAMFEDCENLQTTDFNLPDSVSYKDGYESVFSNCQNLNKYIGDLLPQNGFSQRFVTLNGTFKNCQNLKYDETNNKWKNILWNDFTKYWDVQNPFSGSSLISLVPTDEDWNTKENTNIDISNSTITVN